MNANELADIVDHWAWKESAEYLTDAATMLRQQQAELEHMRSFFGCDPAYYGMTKSHPAKELDEQFKKGFKAGKEEGWKAHKFHHPVKEQLTEEQVIDITKTFFNIHPETNLTEKFNIPLYELTHFARAILRKAQEK